MHFRSHERAFEIQNFATCLCHAVATAAVATIQCNAMMHVNAGLSMHLCAKHGLDWILELLRVYFHDACICRKKRDMYESHPPTAAAHRKKKKSVRGNRSTIESSGVARTDSKTETPALPTTDAQQLMQL